MTDITYERALRQGAQRMAALLASELPETGAVNDATWDALYERFAGIENTVLVPSEFLPPATSFPGTTLQSGMRD